MGGLLFIHIAQKIEPIFFFFLCSMPISPNLIKFIWKSLDKVYNMRYNKGNTAQFQRARCAVKF